LPFGFGSLLLGARRNHDWVYVGAVGTGLKEKDAAYLKKKLDTLKVGTPAVPLKG
jgi:bifunctional non-homologous end joining protein LigD